MKGVTANDWWTPKDWTTHTKGVKRKKNGKIRAYTRVGKLLKEKHFEPDATATEVADWRKSMRVELKKVQPKSVRGAFDQDTLKYLDSEYRKAQRGYGSKRSKLRAWIKEFGGKPRAAIKESEVEKIRDKWINEFTPKEINHRISAARQMFRELDGEHCPTPFDKFFKSPKRGGQKLKVPDTIPTFVTPDIIRDVAINLANPQPTKMVRRKSDGAVVPLGNRRPDPELAKLDQARFLVLAATGQRPEQLRLAEVKDIDFGAGTWLVRPAKDGLPIPLQLNTDMEIALRNLLRLGGIGSEMITPKRGKPRRRGDFSTSDYDKRLYRAGWPKGVRPYNTKHTIGMALADAGIDHYLIADHFGHKDPRTTKIYTTIRAKRLKIASDALVNTRPIGVADVLKAKPKKPRVVKFKKAS